MTEQKCNHQCSGNCRRVGCHCACGEFHEDKCDGNPCEDCRLPYDPCSCSCHLVTTSTPPTDNRPEAVLDRILTKVGVIPTPPPTEAWEERFEDLLKQTLTANPLALLTQTGGLIKTFITQALAEQKACMIEVVEGMKEECTECENREKHDTPRNMLIDDIIKALSR